MSGRIAPEYLDMMDRCYKNWNGTYVMEGAFRELLAFTRNAISTQPPKSIDRDSVLEEAAKIAERCDAWRAETGSRSDIPSAIRALKDTP